MAENAEAENAFMDPPERIPIDYIELAYLAVFFLFGGPINLGACNELHARKQLSRLDLLKRHLNVWQILVSIL